METFVVAESETGRPICATLTRPDFEAGVRLAEAADVWVELRRDGSAYRLGRVGLDVAQRYFPTAFADEWFPRG